MSSVYITNGNLRKITAAFRLKDGAYGPKDFYLTFADFNYDLIKSILSTPEMALICIYKESLSDLEEGISIYKKIEKVDNYKFVYEGTQPAYHFNKNCKNLNSDFQNYALPDILKDDHSGAEKFRKVFRENLHHIKNNKPDVAKMHINLAMGWDMSHACISSVEIRNSDTTTFEENDLEILKNNINQIIFDAEKFRLSSSEASNQIDKLGFGTHKRHERDIEGHPINIWHNIKSNLKYTIQTYFRVRLNPDLHFKGELLDQLGFRPCAVCSENHDGNSAGF